MDMPEDKKTYRLKIRTEKRWWIFRYYDDVEIITDSLEELYSLLK